MRDRTEDRAADETVREDAAAWLARLRAPDGVSHQVAFEEWYSADPRHAEAYDALLDNWERMALAAHTPARQMRVASPTHSMSRTWTAAAAAAAVLLLAFTGLALYASVFGADAKRTFLASSVGDIRTVALPDGSRVTLDTGSAVETAYNQHERRLVLQRGRARFEVAHESERPFVVEARGELVVAHGTIFDVELRGRVIVVSLLRGSVEVRSSAPDGNAAQRPGRLLVPGQQLSVQHGIAAGPPTSVRSAEARWPSGMLSFDNAKLEEVIAAANRYAATPIVLPDEAIRERRFTGTIKANDTEGLARMLAETFRLTLSRAPDGSLVLSQRA